MPDPRSTRLADVITRFSLDVQPGESVLLDFRGAATADLLKDTVTAITEAGGVPFPSSAGAAAGAP